MMLAAVLAQFGLPLLVQAVSAGLGRIDNPIAQTAAKALGEVGGAIGSGQIAPEAVTEANRHLERMAELDSTDWRSALGEVNQSLRAEVASSDAYVRRMRPTFGYIIAVTWGLQMSAVAYAVVTDPGHAGAVVEALASLGPIWTVGLGVLGIYVYRRSGEKLGSSGASTGAGALLARALGRPGKA
jgi:hypothetical protein